MPGYQQRKCNLSQYYQYPVIPVSGTITASNPSVGVNGSPAPADSTEIGWIDGSGNLQGVSAANPLPVAVQGTTPVSGTVTANQGTPGVGAWPTLAAQSGTWTTTVTQATGTNLHTVVDSSALPTGASTSALQTTGNTSLSTIATQTSHLPAALGQTTMSASLPVVIASDQSAVPVSGTITVTGVATASNQTSGAQKTQIVDGSGNVIGSTSNALNVDVTQPLPAGTNVIGHVIVDAGTALIGKVGIDQTTPGTTNAISIAQIGANTVLTGNGVTGTGSQRVTIASDNTAFTVNAAQSGTWTVQPGNTANTTPWLTKESVSATATLTNVASSATSVSLLASNSGRLGATFFNDSTQVLYLKFGATASISSYTVQLAALGYYEMPTPHLYTGAIDGIWASANGNARITELS